MIKRINLNEQIYQSLKFDILEQRIKFGEKLANRELQERFGVSSTPIRDAINQLQSDGLLDNITNVGARIISFNANMALDINEAIAALHREAVAMSLKKGHRNELIPILQQCLSAQMRSTSAEAYFANDRLFHQALFDYCDNECWKKIFSQYSTLWELLVLYYHKDKDTDHKQALVDHQNILSAFTDGNVATTQMYVEAHFQHAIEAFRNMTQEDSRT